MRRFATAGWRASAVLVLVAFALASCSKTTEGPLAFQGIPKSWAGPVAVGQPRAWGRISFGQEDLEASVMGVTFGAPLPDRLATHVELNSGQPVPIGATHRPKEANVQRLPATISGVVQIVVWFDPQRTGIRYFTRTTNIRYSIDDHEYLAEYPHVFR